MANRIFDLALPYLERAPGEHTGLPAVVLIHGRGADAADLYDLAPMIGDGYRFLFPDAPREFEPMPGYRFGLTWFEGLPPEPESFRQSREVMLKWLGQVSERYETPLSRFVIAGFSQGGVMALDCGLRIDPLPAGVVAMSGAFHETDPPDLSRARSVPVCMVHGTGDEVLPLSFARRARALLEESGVDVDYGEYPMAHHVTPESMAQVRRFVERVLPSRPE